MTTATGKFSIKSFSAINTHARHLDWNMWKPWNQSSPQKYLAWWFLQKRVRNTSRWLSPGHPAVLVAIFGYNALHLKACLKYLPIMHLVQYRYCLQESFPLVYFLDHHSYTNITPMWSMWSSTFEAFLNWTCIWISTTSLCLVYYSAIFLPSLCGKKVGVTSSPEDWNNNQC